jgi:hypothetical protein
VVHLNAVFHIDVIDFEQVAELDPVFAHFLASNGGVDPDSYNISSDGTVDPFLQPICEELDDNNNLNFSFGPNCNELSLVATMHPPIDLPWLLAECSEHELLTPCVEATDPASCALHAFGVNNHAMHLSVCKMYQRICEEQHGSATPTHAHLDGGSMATTTDDLSLLWHFHPFAYKLGIPALKVADNHKHYLNGKKATYVFPLLAVLVIIWSCATTPLHSPL